MIIIQSNVLKENDYLLSNKHRIYLRHNLYTLNGYWNICFPEIEYHFKYHRKKEALRKTTNLKSSRHPPCILTGRFEYQSLFQKNNKKTISWGGNTNIKSETSRISVWLRIDIKSLSKQINIISWETIWGCDQYLSLISISCLVCLSTVKKSIHLIREEKRPTRELKTTGC